MKNKFLFFFGALALLMTGLFAFDGGESARPVEVFDGVEYFSDQTPAGSGAIYWPQPERTITNAGKDTLTLPYILASPYQYCFQIAMSNTSGTRNVKFYLEQTAATGSTRYMKVDSAITTGSVPSYMMRGTNVYGNKFRVLAIGAGTQVTKYRIDGLLKKTN